MSADATIVEDRNLLAFVDLALVGYPLGVFCAGEPYTLMGTVTEWFCGRLSTTAKFYLRFQRKVFAEPVGELLGISHDIGSIERDLNLRLYTGLV